MSTALETITIPGSPDGMNVNLPAQDIKDTEAQYIQDALLDKPALTRMRGPVRDVATIAQPTKLITNGAITLDPQGQGRKALLVGTGAGTALDLYAADDLSITEVAWGAQLSSAPYHASHISTGLKGGAFIGTSSQYDVGATQTLKLWMGGNKADYATGTLTIAAPASGTPATATVTGAGTAFLTHVVPGMFLFSISSGTLMYTGYVKSVDSDTQLTLAGPALNWGAGLTYNLQSLRNVRPLVGQGRITCDTSLPTVNGGDTKFLKQALNSGTWDMYRASDSTFIGTVASVASDASLTLVTNATVSMADDAYFVQKRVADSGGLMPGWITATYAGRQFFLNKGDTHENTYRLGYSDTDDSELLDFSLDGNWTPISSNGETMQESGRGALAAYNALIVCKENETFGVFGSTPSEFTIQKIQDDGALSGMSMQQYNGGVIWAGREGIHFYDGVQVTNLMADKFGQEWKDSIRTFDPSTYRMWSMIDRDHYILFIENLDPTIQPTKGGIGEVVTQWTVVINMLTGAPVLWENVGVRGSIVLPAASGHKVWYFVNDGTRGHVCDGDALFDEEALDSITCVGATAGPDFYYESKKFDVGDDLRLKKFKYLAMHYLAQGGALKIDVVLGLNEFGQTLSSSFPASVFTWDTMRAQFGTWTALRTEFSNWSQMIQGVLLPKRVKFQKQSQYFSFRVYKEFLTMPRVKIGPYQIGFKLMRAGRVS